jgi:CRISPR-associated protein Cas1
MPERGQTSGQTLVEQVRAYEDRVHRLDLANSFVQGSIHNMRANVAYYDNRGHDLNSVLDDLDAAQDRLEGV